MMRKGTMYLLAAIWFICSVPSTGNGENDICACVDQPLACLRANFQELYSRNYPRFWKILRQAAAEAERCDPIKKTTAFLDLAGITTNNVEFKEYFNKILERLASERTDCFLAAASSADALTQERIIELLRHPLYVDSIVIDRALKSRINGRYRSLIDLYFHKEK